MSKLSDLKSAAQIAADERRDPGVLAELERTSVAEQVALLLTSYRVEHGLTQTGLAELLGMHQPASPDWRQAPRAGAGDARPIVERAGHQPGRSHPVRVLLGDGHYVVPSGSDRFHGWPR